MKTMQRIAVTCLVVMVMLCAGADDTLESALSELKHIEVGEGEAAMNDVVDLVLRVQQHPEARAELADRLALELSSSGSYEYKKFICRQLYLIGTEDQLRKLYPLLLDATYSAIARYALEDMPGEAVTEALMTAARKLKGDAKIGAVNSLGARRDPLAAPLLREFAESRDLPLATAALTALGEIGGKDNDVYLKGLILGEDPWLAPAALEAYLAGAAQLEGRARAGHYAALCGVNMPDGARLAGFNGLVQENASQAMPLLVQALRSEDPDWYEAGLGAAFRLPGGNVSRTLQTLLPDLDTRRQVALVDVLGRRADLRARAASSAVRAFRTALASESEALRLAAVRAMGTAGDASCVDDLAAIAVGEGDMASAAREALALVPRADADTRIVRCLKAAGDAEACVLMEALAARTAVAQVPVLLAEARQGSEARRAAACQALGRLARPADMDDLTTLLLDAESEVVFQAAQRALVVAARRAPKDAAPVDALVRRAEAATDAGDMAALLGVLASVADPAGLPVLEGGLDSGEPAVRAASLAGLAAWPTAAPQAVLLRVARETADDGERAKALDGCARMIRMGGATSEQEIVPILASVLELSEDAGPKRSVLSVLAGLKSDAALALARTYVDDPTLGEDARFAVGKIMAARMTPSASNNTDQAGLALDKRMDTRWTTNETQRPGQWFEFSLGEPCMVTGVTLNAGPSPGDYPRGYAVYVFADPGDPGEPVATGAGEGAITEISFTPVRGQFVRIVQTGSVGNLWWSIHEAQVSIE